ncbi:MAG: F0F1 ATP synthase subunit A [Nitrospiraceae bacterium]|nr:F0F1 ATP synthase subunit A [Nitrospiraceae bacterium]
MNESTIMDLFINPHIIPPFVSFAFLASALLIIVAIVIRASISLVPRGVQNFVEIIMEAMQNLCMENIGHEWGAFFFPLIGTIFLYILVSNFFGLIPGFFSPTANINMTASMAIPVFIIYQLWGFRVHGLHYIKHFLGPIRGWNPLVLLFMGMMFVIELISHLARPLTLSVRLFGNMIAKHLLLIVLAMIVPLFVPMAILGLGVIVSLVQAYVFALLSVLYIAGAVQEAH